MKVKNTFLFFATRLLGLMWPRSSHSSRHKARVLLESSQPQATFHPEMVARATECFGDLRGALAPLVIRLWSGQLLGKAASTRMEGSGHSPEDTCPPGRPT